MTAYLSPVGNDQFVDVNGNPLTGGKVYTYLAGTSTPADTWTTSAGDVAQPNPIVLNSLGATFNPIWLTAGTAYKIVIKDSLGVSTLYTFDNITGINDPVYSLLSEWVLYATNTPAYISATAFSVLTDQTAIFQAGRRIKTINAGGTVYSTIQTSTFAAGVTTAVVLNDSGVLDSSLSAVYYGFLSSSHPSTPATNYNIGQTPFRNVLINGDFKVSQRHGGASQSYTSSGILYWGPDMFYAITGGAGATGDVTQIADNSIRYNLQGGLGVTSFTVGTRAEYRNCRHLAGSSATISCKASITTPANMTWTAYYANSQDAFGSPGSYTRTQIATGTFAITATEQTYSAIMNIPAAATTGIEIVLSIGALPAGNAWVLGDIQLEKGAITNSSIQFENVDATLQTLRCQRYQVAFRDYFGTASTALNVYDGKIIFPVEMRESPTFDGTPTAASFTVSTGSAGLPALFTDATILTSAKSAFCYNVSSNWTVGANVRLNALLSCNIP